MILESSPKAACPHLATSLFPPEKGWPVACWHGFRLPNRGARHMTGDAMIVTHAVAALALISLTVAGCSTRAIPGDSTAPAPATTSTAAPESSAAATIIPSEQTSFPVQVTKTVRIIAFADADNDCVNANAEFGDRALSVTYERGPSIAETSLAPAAERDGEDCVFTTQVTYTAEDPGEYGIVVKDGSGAGTDVADPAEIYRLFDTTEFTYRQSADGSWTSCSMVTREACLSMD